MKVISPEEMLQIEAQSIAAGASQEEYMQQAGLGIARCVKDYLELHHRQKQVLLLCGKGNNGGDAFTAGQILLEWGIEVAGLHVTPLTQCSPLCQKKAEGFIEKGGRLFSFQDHPPPLFTHHGLILDGLFGTGFKGAIEGPYLELVEWANQNLSPILSIDIPSGLNGTDGTVGSAVIYAQETLFLGLPKLGFFLGAGWEHVGKLRQVDFGISGEFFKEIKSDFTLLSLSQLASFLPPLKRTRHKYEAGAVLVLAGSENMPGAAILTAHAAMKAGAGLVRLVHPKGMDLQGLAPEIVRYAYEDGQVLPWDTLLNKISSVVIGPGLARDEKHVKPLDMLFSLWKGPAVLDADALFFIAKDWLKMPAGALLTPHLGELAPLLKLQKIPFISMDVFKQVRRYSLEQECTVVVKGAPTYVIEKEEPIVLSLHGDPGMATAGSGDVLSGILGALLAQKMPASSAAALGTFLHGFSGECAARQLTSYALTATDLIDLLPLAFQRLLQECNGSVQLSPRSLRP